jgi:hypothetical protein
MAEQKSSESTNHQTATHVTDEHTLFRQIVRRWEPANRGEAVLLLEECLERSVSLSDVLIQFASTYEGAPGWGDVWPTLHLLNDVLRTGYDTLQFVAPDRHVSVGRGGGTGG